MKITNKERNQYINQIKKLLFCSSKERKKFLKEFNDNIDWNCQEKCSRRIPKILDRQISGSVMRELLGSS